MAREYHPHADQNPCRLVRQVNEIGRLQPENLSHLPDNPADVFSENLLAAGLADQSFGPAERAGRSRNTGCLCRGRPATVSRRDFLSQSGLGLGMIALSEL